MPHSKKSNTLISLFQSVITDVTILMHNTTTIGCTFDCALLQKTNCCHDFMKNTFLLSFNFLRLSFLNIATCDVFTACKPLPNLIENYFNIPMI